MSSDLYVAHSFFHRWNRSCPISVVVSVDKSHVPYIPGNMSDDNVPWIISNRRLLILIGLITVVSVADERCRPRDWCWLYRRQWAAITWGGPDNGSSSSLCVVRLFVLRQYRGMAHSRARTTVIHQYDDDIQSVSMTCWWHIPTKNKKGTATEIMAEVIDENPFPVVTVRLSG